MFRNDFLTIERETYKIKDGEAIYEDRILISKDIPCHLSVELNNLVDKYGTPSLRSDFTLFLDYFPNLDIKENDVLTIKTKRNQTYKLYAGEIKMYTLTVQIKCRQEKIIES